MTTTKFRLADLFCSAGGCSAGYARALQETFGPGGWEIVGVDIAPQPRYPYTFVQADAMTFPLAGFDAVHASPPCQRKSRMSSCRPGLAATYPDLIDPTRQRLLEWGGPWVLENVEGAGLPAQDDLLGAHGLMLCGHMFGLPLYRHRYFETSFPVTALHHPRHLIPASRAGHWKPGTIISVEGHCHPIALAREAMGGVDWMTRDELRESIPPAYCEYLGCALLEQISGAAA